MLNIVSFNARCKAAGIHLGLSALIGLLAAVLVFGLWYPWPYREISGGQALFVLIVSVDLVLGPALTFVAFSPNKAKSVLRRDLLIIAILQLGGLAYGVHTVFQARPLAMVYEPGRFRVVTGIELAKEELDQALPEYRTLFVTGPKLLGTREPRNNAEADDAMTMALRGVDIGQRPSYWQPYDDSIVNVLAKARPVNEIYKQYPASIQEIEKYITNAGRNPATVKFLPIIAKESNWSALIDGSTGEVFEFIPFDGFF